MTVVEAKEASVVVIVVAAAVVVVIVVVSVAAAEVSSYRISQLWDLIETCFFVRTFS